MTVKDILDQAKKDYEKYGYKTFKFTAEDIFHGLLGRIGFWVNYGEDFYSREWDLLILVDACRWDLMEEVIDEYEYIETSSSFTSCASHSREWLHKTFKQNNKSGIEKIRVWKDILLDPDNIGPFRDDLDMKDMTDTAYISWNIFTGMLDEEYFDACERVGLEEWPAGEPILEPRKLTDRTIDVMRERNPNRTIVHYMQPHNPFPDDDQDREGNVWERVQRGEKDEEEAWEEYKDNLRKVMDDIGLLLNSVDAEKVIISSDHGNAIGEFGCYGHRPYVPLKAEKKVPWVKTTATNTGEYEPNDSKQKVDIGEQKLESRLENLGYL